MSTFFVIHHFAKPGCEKESAEYGRNKGDAEFCKKEEESWDAAGFHGHCCMIGTGQTFCVWEAQEGKTAAHMQGHIDSAMPFLNNVVYPVDASINGFKPKNVFGNDGTPHCLADSPTLGEHGCNTTSKFYMVEHTCKPGSVDAWVKMTEGFAPKTPKEEEALGKMMEACKDLGFHGHSSLPVSRSEGHVFCLWEVKDGQTDEKLQAFHDDNMGNGGPSLMTNVLHPIDNSFSQGVCPAFG